MPQKSLTASHLVPKVLSHYPVALPKNCGDGQAKIYDECSDQRIILKKAIKQAQKDDKNIIIAYGGEWCIWCHVLDKQLRGKHSSHPSDTKTALATKTKDALALNHYIAEKFIVVHIEGDLSNGYEAIDMTGIDSSTIYYYPYVMMTDKNGKFISEVSVDNATEYVENYKDSGLAYRDYNSKLLLTEFKKAIKKTNNSND